MKPVPLWCTQHHGHKAESMFWAGRCWSNAQRKLSLDHPEMWLSGSDLKQISVSLAGKTLLSLCAFKQLPLQKWLSCLTSCKYTTRVTINVKNLPIKSNPDGNFPQLATVVPLVESTVMLHCWKRTHVACEEWLFRVTATPCTNWNHCWVFTTSHVWSTGLISSSGSKGREEGDCLDVSNAQYEISSFEWGRKCSMHVLDLNHRHTALWSAAANVKIACVCLQKSTLNCHSTSWASKNTTQSSTSS